MDKIKKLEIYICLGLVVLIVLGNFYLFSLRNSKETEQEDAVVDKPSEIIEEKEIEEIEELKDNYVYLNEMDYEYLREPGWQIYYEDDNYVSSLGLDFSEYSGKVDFKDLKDMGFDFVMLRIGRRGTTKGDIYLDDKFEEYYKLASQTDLKIGYYFFSQAKNEEEAKEEARFVIDNLTDKRCDMYVAYDMESTSDGSRIDNLSADQRTKNALAFCKEIKDASFNPMIYTNLDWARNYYSVNQFNNENIPIWLAQYSGYPNEKFKYVMWQYTSKASISGVGQKGYTDLNLMLVKKEKVSE